LVPLYVEFDDDEEYTKDMCIMQNWELYLQVLDHHETTVKYTNSCIALFTRRWNPSTLTLGDFVSTPLSNLDRNELCDALTSSSGLPAEQIEIAMAGTFPCQESLESIQDEMAWISLLSHDRSSEFVAFDGDVVLWRNKDESPKKSTKSQRHN